MDHLVDLLNYQMKERQVKKTDSTKGDDSIVFIASVLHKPDSKDITCWHLCVILSGELGISHKGTHESTGNNVMSIGINHA